MRCVQSLASAICGQREKRASFAPARRDGVRMANPQVLRVSSPLCLVEHEHEHPTHECDPGDGSRLWYSWCPNCKRPLDVRVFDAHRYRTNFHRREKENIRYAYVVALWGENSGFMLGALVLGRALRRSGTKHDLVLLHTSDVPESMRGVLADVWQLHPVEHVRADAGLFYGGKDRSRFSGVFTKLHCLSLVEYDKVLMLDIDLSIIGCMDPLFNLQAPAALWRGEAQTLEHGFSIDGRCFFGGAKSGWGQTGGINAGVMLLAPDKQVFERAIEEVEADFHPERIACTGPEQDYLSRFFAQGWTHLSVLYNFQLHHLWFGLDSALQHFTGHSDGRDGAGSPWLPPRVRMSLSNVRVMHFSGEIKFWNKEFSSRQTRVDLADAYLRSNDPYRARLWLDRKGNDKEYAAHGIRYGDNTFKPLDVSLSASALQEIIDGAVSQIREATRLAMERWFEDMNALPDVLSTVSSMADLQQLLSRVPSEEPSHTPGDNGRWITHKNHWYEQFEPSHTRDADGLWIWWENQWYERFEPKNITDADNRWIWWGNHWYERFEPIPRWILRENHWYKRCEPRPTSADDGRLGLNN